MRYLGFSINRKTFNGLPSKIRRAVMMGYCGLPVTDYLIMDLRSVPKECIVSELSKELQRAEYGLVVRTVTMADNKLQPYCLLEDPVDIAPTLKKTGGCYVMAFAARAKPEKAHGWIVSRYFILPEGGCLLEYCKDEISARALDRVTNPAQNSQYGNAVKEPGCFWRSSTKTAEYILRRLWHYEEKISLLLDILDVQRISLEFVLHGSKIRFNDFDL